MTEVMDAIARQEGSGTFAEVSIQGDGVEYGPKK